MDNNEHAEELSAAYIETIVKRVQDGEMEQYRLLVLHFQRRIHIYCYHMIGNEAEAEDAVQEAFI